MSRVSSRWTFSGIKRFADGNLAHMMTAFLWNFIITRLLPALIRKTAIDNMMDEAKSYKSSIKKSRRWQQQSGNGYISFDIRNIAPEKGHFMLMAAREWINGFIGSNAQKTIYCRARLSLMALAFQGSTKSVDWHWLQFTILYLWLSLWWHQWRGICWVPCWHEWVYSPRGILATCILQQNYKHSSEGRGNFNLLSSLVKMSWHFTSSF
jgi:hypothetical protein